VLQWLQPGSAILELNAGTGDDAIFFAQLGHTVHATDISAAMQDLLAKKAKKHGLQNNITHELRSYTDLEDLQSRGPYDLIFSNFAGLNCTNKLPGVLQSFDSVLKPGGLITLVVLPKFCLWEFLLLFKGKFKIAFRRFSGTKGTKAHIEGEFFRCWYYDPSFIRKHLEESFDMVALEGLCTFVPPSYLEGFADKYPKIYKSLINKESKWKMKWPWNGIGDYYIITLKKKR
ncbi:MAG TPA: class I SAM-dependent methyltransferase, partial [Chitinophagaceae bacterium]|nr:class I SAM-dependent methyltransferase [Chitinophagaceae bacterium]